MIPMPIKNTIQRALMHSLKEEVKEIRDKKFIYDLDMPTHRRDALKDALTWLDEQDVKNEPPFDKHEAVYELVEDEDDKAD